MINCGADFEPAQPPAGASVPGFPVTEDQRAQNFVAQETHTFSPTVVGVARFSFLQNNFVFGERPIMNSPATLAFNTSPASPAAAGPPFKSCRRLHTVGAPITGPREHVRRHLRLLWAKSAGFAANMNLNSAADSSISNINILQGIATNGFFVFAPFPFTTASPVFSSVQPVFFLQGGGNFQRGIREQASESRTLQDTYKASLRA